MEKQTLSDKIHKVELDYEENDTMAYYEAVEVKNIRDFIKKLKEEMPNQDLGEAKAQQELIDRLAGDKLI